MFVFLRNIATVTYHFISTEGQECVLYCNSKQHNNKLHAHFDVPPFFMFPEHNTVRTRCIGTATYACILQSKQCFSREACMF